MDYMCSITIRDLAYSNRALVNRQDQSSVSETVRDEDQKHTNRIKLMYVLIFSFLISLLASSLRKVKSGSVYLT